MLTAEEQSRAGFLASVERFEWAGDRTRLDRIECDSEAAALACLIEENAKAAVGCAPGRSCTTSRASASAHRRPSLASRASCVRWLRARPLPDDPGAAF